MSAVTDNDFSEETHPWNFYIPDGATKLFVGTFPAYKRKHNFFYSSATNRFWEVLSEIVKPFDEIGNEADEIKKREKIVEKLHLGLTDMGKKVLRQQSSSKDHKFISS